MVGESQSKHRGHWESDDRRVPCGPQSPVTRRSRRQHIPLPTEWKPRTFRCSRGVLCRAHLIITQKATRWESGVVSFDAHLGQSAFLPSGKIQLFLSPARKLCRIRPSAAGHKVTQLQPESFFFLSSSLTIVQKTKKAGITSKREELGGRGDPLITNQARCSQIAPFLQGCG